MWCAMLRRNTTDQCTEYVKQHLQRQVENILRKTCVTYALYPRLNVGSETVPRGMMNLHLEDGMSKRTQHRNRDATGYSINPV